jgi:hypothetical protein
MPTSPKSLVSPPPLNSPLKTENRKRFTKLVDKPQIYRLVRKDKKLEFTCNFGRLEDHTRPSPKATFAPFADLVMSPRSFCRRECHVFKKISEACFSNAARCTCSRRADVTTDFYTREGMAISDCIPSRLVSTPLIHFSTLVKPGTCSQLQNRQLTVYTLCRTVYSAFACCSCGVLPHRINL